MSVFIFPSRQTPYFYFSENKNVIRFFIFNFLYSRRPSLQWLINIIRLYIPGILSRFLLRTILCKADQLPSQLKETFSTIKAFIGSHAEVFPIAPDEIKNIHYIIRSGAWQRTDDKFVILLFTNQGDKPFAIAKVATAKHYKNIELEYVHTNKAYTTLKNSSFLIAEPVTFHIFEKVSVYFERFSNGVTLNNYLKGNFSFKEKEKIYADVLHKSRDFLASMNRTGNMMASQDFLKYFYHPVEKFLKTELTLKHASKLTGLKSYVDQLQETGLCSVWMHGDLWGGSLLFEGKTITVIDWEFFTEKGVPLWDFFSLAFHIGADLSDKAAASSDFMNYFTNALIAEAVDEHLLFLAEHSKIKMDFVPLLFQCYLLFNIHTRDTDKEKYWENCLKNYWETTMCKNDNHHKRIL